MKRILILVSIILLCFTACGNENTDSTTTTTTTVPVETTTENPNKTYEATLKNETENTNYTISTENGIVTKVVMHKEYNPPEGSEYDYFTYEQSDAEGISKARGVEKKVTSNDNYKTIIIDMTVDYSSIEPDNIKDIIFSEDLDDDALMFEENTFDNFKSLFLGGYEITEK